MKDINLQTTLPALSFDYDKLMAWAKGISAQFENLVVREEDIAGIKSEMAGLNKAKKAVDDVRKEAVKRVSAPIRQFEEQIKEVCAVFTETYDFLKGQVQAHEDRAREDKRVQVQFMIDNLKDEHGVPDIPIEIDQSWLNKSKELKDVKAAIEGIILAHIKAEREAAQLEQAKKDRAVSIEEKCDRFATAYGFALPASKFLRLQSLEIPMEEVTKAIENAYKLTFEQNRMQACEAAAKESVPQPAQEAVRPTMPSAPVRPMPLTRTVVIEINYEPSAELAVQAKLRELQEICNVKIVANAA